MPAKPLSQWPWNVRNRERNRNSKRPYRHRSKYADRYEQIPAEQVPDGIKWKPGTARPSPRMTILFSMGNIYKLMRERETGAVTYYKLKDIPEATPKEKIDAELTRGHQIRYRKGARCWYIDAGHWFLVDVVDRTPTLITISSITGWDADRQVPWPCDENLAFSPTSNNPLFRRLRPLRDRYM